MEQIVDSDFLIHVEILDGYTYIYIMYMYIHMYPMYVYIPILEK